jgi:hypothetical protein
MVFALRQQNIQDLIIQLHRVGTLIKCVPIWISISHERIMILRIPFDIIVSKTRYNHPVRFQNLSRKVRGES